MKPFISFMLILLLTSTLSLKAKEQLTVPYTLEDRDRIIRTESKMDVLESKMDALETKMDVKFEAVNARIDYLFWLQGVIVALILFTLGYTIWDRRTALQPALDKSLEAEAKSTNLIRVLREYAQSHPDLANILRSHGIL